MYNTEKFIVRCLESCYKQGLSEDSFEVIVIDDGSTDLSFSIVEEFKKTYKNLLLFHQKNQGQGAARNLGMMKAKGKYIEFLDSDDYLLPYSISYILKEAISNSLEIANFLIEIEREDGKVELESKYEKLYDRILSGEDVILLSRDIGSVCGSLYSNKIIKKNKLKFVTDIKHEDVAFQYTLLPYVHRIKYYKRYCYFYGYNINSTDRSYDIASKKLLMYSDLRIAKLLNQYSIDSIYSDVIRVYFKRLSNSLIVSSFLFAFKNRCFSKKELINSLKEMDLIPVYGLTLSWKTTLFLPFINLLRFF